MEKLEEIFKKIAYTGIGLVSMTKDRIEKAVEELIDKNEIHTNEGERIINEFFKNTETKKDELEKDLKLAIEKIVAKFNFATTKDLEELKKRLETLEKSANKK